jgi:hypothetical protein
MNSLKTKSRKAAISKTDPLISVLRNCYFIWEERELTHAQWFENHKSGVMAAGRVLQFLGLARAIKRVRFNRAVTMWQLVSGDRKTKGSYEGA